MSSLVIGFLTFILILDCVFLVFLVLLQLPKKEAGAGVAFGGGATDALFGAGSGNMLTKITKWTAGIFFSLCLVLAVMSGHQSRQTGARSLTEELANRPKTAPTAASAGLLSNTPSAVAVPAADDTTTPKTPSTPAPAPTPSTPKPK